MRRGRSLIAGGYGRRLRWLLSRLWRTGAIVVDKIVGGNLPLRPLRLLQFGKSIATGFWGQLKRLCKPGLLGVEDVQRLAEALVAARAVDDLGEALDQRRAVVGGRAVGETLGRGAQARGRGRPGACRSIARG